jgi:hypothetical protein
MHRSSINGNRCPRSILQLGRLALRRRFIFADLWILLDNGIKVHPRPSEDICLCTCGYMFQPTDSLFREGNFSLFTEGIFVLDSACMSSRTLYHVCAGVSASRLYMKSVCARNCVLKKNLDLAYRNCLFGSQATQRTRIGQVWRSDPPNIMEDKIARHWASRAGDGGDPNNASKGYFRRLLYGFGAARVFWSSLVALDLNRSQM